MPRCILTDFKVSGPKSWNVQIAMSVKLRLPCFSKDIQAWLLHAFDICRLVSPPPAARTGAGAPRRTADRRFVGSQVRFLSRSPFLLTSLCRTCLSQCSQSSWKRSSWHLCAFPFFSLIIFNLIYDYSCSRFIDIRYGSRFFVNSIYDYSCS